MNGRAAAVVDAAAPGPVLVVGSLPPDGRDLDVVVCSEAAAAIASRLEADGFVRGRDGWARFADCCADAVELIAAAEWPEPDGLLERSLAVEGYTHLRRPSPADVVLIQALLVKRSRSMPAKRRARALAAAAEDPGAWDAARARAHAWGVSQALALLERCCRENRPPTRNELVSEVAWRPRVRRGHVLALSGLDGAGKSTQSAQLAEALEALGFDVVVVWSPLGGSPVLDAVGKPVKRVLRRLRFGPFRTLAEQAASGSVMAHPTRIGSRPSHVRAAWSTFVAVVNAAGQRRDAVRHMARGRVVVLDRQALDTIVRLRFLYGDSAWLRLQRTLILLLAPRPLRSWFLDIRPETSLARKDDIWSVEQLARHRELYLEELPQLGVRRLDGERARETLCAEIQLEAWRALTS